jgi:hypothetical protein
MLFDAIQVMNGVQKGQEDVYRGTVRPVSIGIHLISANFGRE